MSGTAALRTALVAAEAKLKRMRDRLAAAEEDENEALIRSVASLVASAEAEVTQLERAIEEQMETTAGVDEQTKVDSDPGRSRKRERDDASHRTSQGSLHSPRSAAGGHLQPGAIQLEHVKGFIVPVMKGIPAVGPWEVELVQRSYFERVLSVCDANAEWIAWTPFQWPILYVRWSELYSNAPVGENSSSRSTSLYQYIVRIYEQQLSQLTSRSTTNAATTVGPLFAELKASFDVLRVMLSYTTNGTNPNSSETMATDTCSHSTPKVTVGELVPLINLFKSTLLRLSLIIYGSYHTRHKLLPSREELLRGECHLAPWLHVALSRSVSH